MKEQLINYHELELMIHKKSDKQTESRFASILNRIWNGIVRSIATPNEPIIHSRKDKSGNSYWAVHDPLLGHRVFFNSETEVRAWLDRRYYK